MAEVAPIFATMLRQWRAHRRLSQLELAGLSGVSQRHLSFLETGRANPSRGMVLALADALEVPLRDRNHLLQSAGFSAAFKEAPFEEDGMSAFNAALQQILSQQEPYPALVLDGLWNLKFANPSALRFFGLFVDPLAGLAAIGSPTEFQMVRLCLHEEGLKPYIVNWQELIASFLSRARRALLTNPRHDKLPVLIDEILNHADAPQDWRTVWSANTDPAVPMVLRKENDTYRLFTMLAHFGAAQDITLEETSVELFYPADEFTRRRLEQLAR